MVLNVVSVAGGKGICFPESVIDALGISDRITLKARKNDIVITPVKQSAPREDWNAAFREMNKNGDDSLCFNDNNADFEWEW